MNMFNKISSTYHEKRKRKNSIVSQSSAKIIELSKIKRGDLVLDVACGTGIPLKQISSVVKNEGFVVGIDIARNALQIAKKVNRSNINLDFIQSDAEHFQFSKKFDVIICQYALFFFPNAQNALRNMAMNLKKTGTLGVVVHGNNMPHALIFNDVKKKFMRSKTSPLDLNRFGTIPALKNVVEEAKFEIILCNEYRFPYVFETFGDYWNNQFPHPEDINALNKLTDQQKQEFKNILKIRTRKFMCAKSCKIVFSRPVLFLTAKLPSNTTYSKI